jgi:hypothetical protein
MEKSPDQTYIHSSLIVADIALSSSPENQPSSNQRRGQDTSIPTAGDVKAPCIPKK